VTRFFSCIALAVLITVFPLAAQDSDDAGGSRSAGSASAVTVSGEVSASLLGYIEDFSHGTYRAGLEDIFFGKLNFTAETPFAGIVVNLKLQQLAPPEPVDELFVRFFFDNFEIEGGLRKLTWGKASSFGPLDVINPLDTAIIYTEMADRNDLMNVKIARPLIHASYRIGSFSKIEAVFIPWFEPMRFAEEGRWAMKQLSFLKKYTEEQDFPLIINKPNTDDIAALDYAQAGIRFTTTIGESDIGVQYYYGRLPQPAVGLVLNLPPDDPDFTGPWLDVNYRYNSYHQIGVDYAQVLFDFNIRAEAAANITQDLSGDDGTVYNPSIAWSLGFDRDFLGINWNLQVNESIRLMHGKLGKSDFENLRNGNYDIEGGMFLTATRIMATISKKFLGDELELRLAGLCGIEDGDFLIMPALIWTKDDFSLSLSGGIFGGYEDGQFGQYKDNGFIKAAARYRF
jgi:hypothetical protein